MTMVTSFSIKKHFEAPLEMVFELLSDLEHAEENIRGIEKLELLAPGPVGAGSRFRETRMMFGTASTEEMDVTAFDPPHGYTVECESCGAQCRADYHLVSDIAGTHVRLDFIVRPISLLAKLVSPFSRLMLRPMKKMMEADLDDLKAIAETRRNNLRSILRGRHQIRSVPGIEQQSARVRRTGAKRSTAKKPGSAIN